MVVVSPNLIERHIDNPLVSKVYRLLEADEEVQTLLRMANVMAVSRLRYNDHGPVHARIVAGSALELFDTLRRHVQPSIVRDGVGSEDDALVAVLCGSYLHDIGNSVHRVNHHAHSYYLAIPILNRLLGEIYTSKQHMIRVRQEILHSLYAHENGVQCLTMEAGVAKVADGTDMSEGRARFPYLKGKVDIHSLSALAVKKVEILRGDIKPVKLLIDMSNPAGVFQIEWVLETKLSTSGLQEYVEVSAQQDGKELKVVR